MYSVYNPQHNKKWENLHMFPLGDINSYPVLKRCMFLTKNIGGGAAFCFTEDHVVLLYDVEFLSDETKKQL